MGKLEELKSGIKTAYIDSSYNSNLAYRPEFISDVKNFVLVLHLLIVAE